jgi:hypothetical protein
MRLVRRGGAIVSALLVAASIAASWAAAGTTPAPASVSAAMPASPGASPGLAPSVVSDAGPPGISAYFVLPAATVAANERQLTSMDADAITFGYRLKRASTSDFPLEVQRLIGSRTPFSYTGGGDWAPAALRPADRTVRICWVTWTVMDTGKGTVVVSSNADDRLSALTAAGNLLGAKTFVGLPAPSAGSQDGVAYLPDTSYLPTLAAFTQRFVADARAEGADGFYQHVEMPVTDSTTWAPVRALYTAQNAAVDAVAPGSPVIVSPYLESREGKAHFTPAQAGRGAAMIRATAHGTRLVIAPQDGLGTGTTRLAADGTRGYVAPLEQYLAAMRSAVGADLWTNLELMRPGANGGREVTTQARVREQLSAEAPYVSGAIAFIWDDRTRGIGAVRVLDGLGGLTRGFGTTGR